MAQFYLKITITEEQASLIDSYNVAANLYHSLLKERKDVESMKLFFDQIMPMQKELAALVDGLVNLGDGYGSSPIKLNREEGWAEIPIDVDCDESWQQYLPIHLIPKNAIAIIAELD